MSQHGLDCKVIPANFFIVVTQVFPDEFHLHTLDQFLSATARLNPHVNVKAIVIGLMDRLSAYASREAESETPEDKKKAEEEATVRLLEQLKIAKEKKPVEAPKQQNGEQQDGENPAKDDASIVTDTTAVASTSEETPLEAALSDDTSKKTRGIPENVKLFEIFHEQVASLVRLQRLPIQDTIAMLVSLANLALYSIQNNRERKSKLTRILGVYIPTDSNMSTKSYNLQMRRLHSIKTVPTFIRKPRRAQSLASSCLR